MAEILRIFKMNVAFFESFWMNCVYETYLATVMIFYIRTTIKEYFASKAVLMVLTYVKLEVIIKTCSTIEKSLAVIAMNFNRSNRGLDDRLAWSSTRWLKLSQLNSRLKYICFNFFMIDYLQFPAQFLCQKYLRTDL